MIALVKRAGFFLLILLATGSCYFPSDFKADIRIDTKGNYVFVYKGNLTDLSMAQRMARGDLAGDALVKRIGVAERDLRRLKGFEKLDYTEKARFKVDYVRRGNILFEKSFNFVRLSSRFLTIKYDKRKHEISVEGGKPNEHHANALEKAGL